MSTTLKPYIKYGVAVLVALVVKLFVPVDYGLTEVGLNMLAVLLGTIVLWIVDDIGWPSLLAFSLFIIGGLPAGELIAASWGSSLILMCICCIMLTLTMSETGVTPAIANWFITRKVCKKRPYVFITMFFLAFYVVCMVMDITPVIMIFCSMAHALCKKMGYEKTDKFYISLMVGILWISSFCQAATPISHTSPMMMMSIVESAFGTTLSFGEWMKIGIPFSLIMMVITILLIRIVIRPDVSKYMDFDIETAIEEKKKISLEGKITIVIFIAVILAWMLPVLGDSFLPALTSNLSRIGSAVPPMVGIALLCLLRVKGKPIVDLAKVSSQVPWKLEYFFMTITAVSAYIGSEVTGIRDFLTNIMSPIIESMHPLLLLIFICVGCVILTNFISNAVAMTVFFYIGAFAITGISPIALGFMLTAIANFSVLIAPSCIYSAYIFGNDYLTVRNTLKVNIIYLAISVTMMIVVIYPLTTILWPV